jgi:hypothetical protein
MQTNSGGDNLLRNSNGRLRGAKTASDRVGIRRADATDYSDTVSGKRDIATSDS